MPATGERAICARCHTVLIAPKRKAGLKIIALSLAMLILVVAAVFFPFLEIRVSGLENQASILDSAFSFRSGALAFLAVATAAMIVLIPVMRMVLILYVLTPIVYDRKPFRHARHAFRLSQKLKPWAMAEIFAIGCAVALVKVADLAQIGFGPAFWMFTALVVIVLINDKYLCTWSVWKSLEQEQD
jgi:paraquat-inducible protein A